MNDKNRVSAWAGAHSRGAARFTSGASTRCFGDVQGDRKQFIEELLSQSLGENQQVYILVCLEQPPDRSVSMPATSRDWAVVGGQK